MITKIWALLVYVGPKSVNNVSEICHITVIAMIPSKIHKTVSEKSQIKILSKLWHLKNWNFGTYID